MSITTCNLSKSSCLYFHNPFRLIVTLPQYIDDDALLLPSLPTSSLLVLACSHEQPKTGAREEEGRKRPSPRLGRQEKKWGPCMHAAAGSMSDLNPRLTTLEPFKSRLKSIPPLSCHSTRPPRHRHHRLGRNETTVASPPPSPPPPFLDKQSRCFAAAGIAYMGVMPNSFEWWLKFAKYLVR